jgi:hypothetical protein
MVLEAKLFLFRFQSVLFSPVILCYVPNLLHAGHSSVAACLHSIAITRHPAVRDAPCRARVTNFLHGTNPHATYHLKAVQRSLPSFFAQLVHSAAVPPSDHNWDRSRSTVTSGDIECPSWHHLVDELVFFISELSLETY